MIIFYLYALFQIIYPENSQLLNKKNVGSVCDTLINMTQCKCTPNDLHVTDAKKLSLLYDVSCEAHSIEQITKTLSESANMQLGTITNFELTSSDTGYISDNVFKYFSNLKSLSLINIKLKNVSTNAFRRLKGLEWLNLKVNDLLDVPKTALIPLTNLRDLDLSYNRINQVGSFAFSSLTKLKTLHLETNEIVHIDGWAFAGLENSLLELQLQNNQLKILPVNSFTHLRTLEKLDLARNHIEILGPSDPFLALRSLISLNLGFNPIKIINANAFRGLISLKALFMPGTLLSFLTPETFTHLVQLEYLILSENNLHHLPNNAFIYLRNLRTLNLEKNKLKTIAPYAFNGTEESLTYIHLKGNQLSQIPSQALKPLKNCWVLNLANNIIKNIDANALTAPIKQMIGTLYLNGNLLTTIPSKFLQGFDALWYLDLSYNEIYEIKNDSIPLLPALEIINLAYNKIETIATKAYNHTSNNISNTLPLKRFILTGNKIFNFHSFCQTFQNFTELRKLDLDLNLIKQLTFVDMRCINSLNVNHLRSLDLSKNKLTVIPSGTFNSIEKRIDLIDLSHNSITRFSKNTFVDSFYITAINTSYNHISSIDNETFVNMVGLKALNFSHNSIIYISSNTFKGVPSLKLLDMSHNNLGEISALTFKHNLGIEWIDLSHNNISYISAHAFAGLYKIKQLYLQYNHLLSLEYGIFNRIDMHQLQILDLRQNLWMCDCSIRWLRDWLKEYGQEKQKHNFVQDRDMLNDLKCYGPPHLINLCITCIPVQAFVCMDYDYSEGSNFWLTMTDFRGRNQKPRKMLHSHHFSWIRNVKHYRKYKRLFFVVSALLGLCILTITILLAVIGVSWRKKTHRNGQPLISKCYNPTVSRSNLKSGGTEPTSLMDDVSLSPGTDDAPPKGTMNDNSCVKQNVNTVNKPEGSSPSYADIRLYGNKRDVNLAKNSVASNSMMSETVLCNRLTPKYTVSSIPFSVQNPWIPFNNNNVIDSQQRNPKIVPSKKEAFTMTEAIKTEGGGYHLKNINSNYPNSHSHFTSTGSSNLFYNNSNHNTNSDESSFIMNGGTVLGNYNAYKSPSYLSQKSSLPRCYNNNEDINNTHYTDGSNSLSVFIKSMETDDDIKDISAKITSLTNIDV